MDQTQLSRQTFYQIFDTKDEIIEYYLDSIFQQFMVEKKKHTLDNLCDAAKLFFSFFQAHQEPLRLFINNNKSCLIGKKCRSFLLQEKYIQFNWQGIQKEEEKYFVTTFVIDGMVGMLEQWMKKDGATQLETQDLAKLVCKITGQEGKNKTQQDATK